MKRIPAIASFAAALMLFSCGGGQQVSPIEGAGRMPGLMEGLPEGRYLALGYLDLDAFFSSDVGQLLLSRTALQTMLLSQATGLNIETGIREVALAVRFDAGAYPILYQALPALLLIRGELQPQALLAVMGAAETTVTSFGGVDVFSFPASLQFFGGGTAFVASPEEGVLAVSTSRQLMQEVLEVRAGERDRLAADGQMRRLLSRADKTRTGWLAIEHDEQSRSLLTLLAGFDDCQVRLNCATALQVLCVMDFPEEQDARGMVKSFGYTISQVENLAKSYADTPDGAASRQAVDILSSIEASQRGRLAIFELELEAPDIELLLGPQPELHPEDQAQGREEEQ